MATKDFRASQVRLSQIIASGSGVGNKPSILIVSASDSANYEGEALSNATLLADVGTDVFMFVTGSKSTREAVTLFGGDVVISGTMYAEKLVAEVNQVTTGSLMVSGSLVVSQSATIHEGLVVNESGEGGSENDFRVESNTKTHSIFVDASTDQVLILSGGGATSYNEAAAADINFYVSGTAGSRGTSVRGTAVFGGDVVISGTVHGLGGGSGIGEVTGWFTGSAGNTPGGGEGAGWISSTGSLAISGSDGLFVSQYISHINDTHTRINLTDNVMTLEAGGTVTLQLDQASSQKEININNSANDVDFNVYADTTGKKLIYGIAQPSNEQVLILSGGAATSVDESAKPDIAFYVSGSIGSKGTSAKGTAVFGGDLFTSGTLYASSSLKVGNSTISEDGDNDLTINAGRIILDPDETDQQAFLLATNGAAGLVIAAGAMGLGLNSGTGQLTVTSSQVVVGSTSAEFSSAAPPIPGADSSFFVSGSVGSRGTSVRGSSVFGGDLMVSGGLYVSGTTAMSVPIYLGASGDDGTNSPMIELKSDKESGTSSDRAIQLSANKGIIHIDAGYDLSTPVATAGMSRYIGGRGLDTRICGTVATNPTFYLSVDESQSATSIWMATDEGGIRLDADGANGYGTVLIQATTANDADSIKLKSTAGGMLFDVDATSGKKFHVDVESSDADSIHLDTKGGINLGAEGQVFLSGSQVLILSGALSAATSPNEANGTDVNLFVSGAVGSRGAGAKGTALFGGDVLTSGSLTVENYNVNGGSISGSIHQTSAGLSYLVAGANITIASGTNGQVTIASSGGGAADAVGWSGPANEIIATTGSLSVGTNSATPGNADIYFASDGGAVFNEQGAAVDFRVESDNKENALFVDGSTDQVLILSGGGATSYNEASGADVNFYVSGTVGSRGTSARGTTVFGGDAVISGALYVSTPGAGQDVIFYGEDSSAIGLQWDADGGDHGKLTLGQDDHGVDFQVYGEDSNNYINWQQASNTLSLYAPQGAINTKGNVVFDVSSQGWDFTVNTNNKTGIFVNGSTDQVLILSGGAATSSNEANGTDVNFFVSGTVGAAGSSVKGAALFGGDLVTSGSFLPGADHGSNLGSPTRRFANIYTGDLHLKNERGDWTIVEEEDYLCVVNNKSGKKFKMALIPLDE